MTGKSYILVIGRHVDELPLGEAAEHVRACGDVYRGLARVGRDQAICGVVVDVAEITAERMEFFALVPRLRSELPVYVTSSVNSVMHRIGDSIGFGATGELDAHAISLLVRACEGRAAEPVESTLTESDREQPDVAEPVVSVGEISRDDDQSELAVDEIEESEDDEFDSSDDEELPVDEEADNEPARVPWLRYSDVPDRRGPSVRREPPRREPPQRKPPADSSTPGDAPHDTEDAYEPLLTDEELAALLENGPRSNDSGDQARHSNEEESGGMR